MARISTTDTVINKGVEEQLGEKAEQSELNFPQTISCEMCRFLIEARNKATSKQATAEYSVAFVDHHIKYHLPRYSAASEASGSP